MGDVQAAIEALRLTREASRPVLDRRVARSNDLDDEATRTRRTGVIGLGILTTGAGVVGGAAITSLSWGASSSVGLGGIGFFLTPFVGAGTYAVSVTAFGCGASRDPEARDEGHSESEWLDLLLDGSVRWSRRPW